MTMLRAEELAVHLFVVADHDGPRQEGLDYLLKVWHGCGARLGMPAEVPGLRRDLDSDSLDAGLDPDVRMRRAVLEAGRTRQEPAPLRHMGALRARRRLNGNVNDREL
jgi:hypothetical protein